MTSEQQPEVAENTENWGPVGLLAPLLYYPGDALPGIVGQIREELENSSPKTLETLSDALEAFETLPMHTLEELYTQTFDLNPVCTLEVGWHLYGEQYERGRFLVRTREFLFNVGLDEGGELPDFLPTLLRALPLTDSQEAQDVASYLIPALRRMCRAFEDKPDGEADDSVEQGPGEGDSEVHTEDQADAENLAIGQDAAKASMFYPSVLVAVREALELRVPETAINEAEARFRPFLEGGRQRGTEPGPNGDFPLEETGGIIKLGVPGTSEPKGGVVGLSPSEFSNQAAAHVGQPPSTHQNTDQRSDHHD